MGFISNISGLSGLANAVGGAIKDTSEVFHVNETAQMQAQEGRFQSALAQYQSEFSAQQTWFDSLINGLNRLPRPAMALGTIGLFIYAMKDPSGFSVRMEGLSLIPEPLWWLLGAIVGFYFGARELHHFRGGVPSSAKIANDVAKIGAPNLAELAEPKTPEVAFTSSVAEKVNIDLSKVANDNKTKDNAAILEWLSQQRG